MIETDRLVIRPTKKEDTDFCLSIWLDPEMGKYLCDPPREKAGSAYLKWADEVEIYSGCYYFVAQSKDGTLIGTCSLVMSDDLKTWDLGYAIHQDYWRQGFALEMLEGLIEYCVLQGAQVISADVAQENIASNALLRKLGFIPIHEGTFKKSQTDIVYSNYTYQLVL